MKNWLLALMLLFLSPSIYCQEGLEKTSERLLNEGLELYQMMLALEKSKKDLSESDRKIWNFYDALIFKKKKNIMVSYQSRDRKKILNFCFKKGNLGKQKKEIKKVKNLKKDSKIVRDVYNDIYESWLTKDGYLEEGEFDTYAIFLIEKKDFFKGFWIWSSIEKEVFRLGHFREYEFDKNGVRKKMTTSGCSAEEINKAYWSKPDEFPKHWHYSQSSKMITPPEIAKALFKCDDVNDDFKFEVASEEYVSIFYPKRKKLEIISKEEYDKKN